MHHKWQGSLCETGSTERNGLATQQQIGFCSLLGAADQAEGDWSVTLGRQWTNLWSVCHKKVNFHQAQTIQCGEILVIWLLVTSLGWGLKVCETKVAISLHETTEHSISVYKDRSHAVISNFKTSEVVSWRPHFGHLWLKVKFYLPQNCFSNEHFPGLVRCKPPDFYKIYERVNNLINLVFTLTKQCQL